MITHTHIIHRSELVLRCQSAGVRRILLYCCERRGVVVGSSRRPVASWFVSCTSSFLCVLWAQLHAGVRTRVHAQIENCLSKKRVERGCRCLFEYPLQIFTFTFIYPPIPNFLIPVADSRFHHCFCFCFCLVAVYVPSSICIHLTSQPSIASMNS